MIRVISRDLGATKTFKRREVTAIVGGQWPDGRDLTAWIKVSAARRRRVGARMTNEQLSRYAVSEVKEIGFLGRTFVFDREFPSDDELERDPNIPTPPYRVRLDQHGSATCGCMGSVGHHHDGCKHTDSVLVLIEEQAFGEHLEGF